MFPLITPRINLTQITEQEWPHFLRLQQDPDVMCYVSEDRKEAEIRQTFNSRLVRWELNSRHWLCLAMRDKQNGRLIGFKDLCVTTRIGLKSALCSIQPSIVRVMALNLCTRFADSLLRSVRCVS